MSSLTGSNDFWVMDGALISQDYWRDSAGVEWRLRKGGVSITRLRRLLRNPGVEVVHQYGEEAKAVPASARLELLARAEPYLDGQHLVGDFGIPDRGASGSGTGRAIPFAAVLARSPGGCRVGSDGRSDADLASRSGYVTPEGQAPRRDRPRALSRLTSR